MTDLHTHILPGMDDGAKTVEDSLSMLRMEREQGVDTVVLTPHFYRDRENPKRFLQRRKDAAVVLGRQILSLPEGEREKLPRMRLGAEVTWWPNMAEWEELPDMCIGKTKNLLLELPFTPWNDQMMYRLHDFYGQTGITPVIAHLERYLKGQQPEYIREVLRLGFPIQLDCDLLLRPLSRGGILKLLRQGQAHLLASDCHDCVRRAPNLNAAIHVVRSKLGEEQADKLIRFADRLTEEE